jgi:4-aminobutyrate aminotransferase
VGAYALDRLRDMKARHPLIGDARGLGLLLGIQLVSDRASKEPAVEAAESVLYRCLERGLSFKITMGSMLTLSPPLIISEQEMDRALAILEDAIAQASAT